MFGLSLSSLGFKLGAVAAIALFAFIGGWRVESWRWSAADADVTKQNAAKIVAIERQYSAAENSDMERLNDLNSRLLAAKQKLAKDHLTGVCFDPNSLRDINGAITGQTAASR